MAILTIAISALTLTSQLTSALGSDGDDQPITGSALEDCTAAALAVNPGGTVTESGAARQPRGIETFDGLCL